MEYLDFPVKKIREGLTEVFVPDLDFFEKPFPSYLPVFFNPIMELNRDFAVLVLQVFQSENRRWLDVCEPLAGCGIRGIRFAKEVEGVKKVVVNDINLKAYMLTQKNILLNKVENFVEAYNEDANFLLTKYAKKGGRFDVVDLDPYGSPIPYLNSALRATKSEGLLCMTATDMAVLCGVHQKACLRHYGAKPLRTEYCHELAVRILFGSVAVSAARIDLAVKPVFCHSTDHYIRVYVKVLRGAKKADQTLRQLGYIFHCFKCLNREVFHEIFPDFKLKCQVCGSLMDFSGPLWLGKLWEKEFVKKMVETVDKKILGQKKRITKILER
ncbi:tRNA (guanine(10)-N(2))-dimethyltransferase, partial [Candidatus Bathyarchaeota archaeon]